DRDPAGKALARLFHQPRIRERHGAEDHAPDALRKPMLDPRHVANAAAQLRRNSGRMQDRLDRGAVDRLALDGTIEVDEMQPGEARRLPAPRLIGGIGVEYGGRRHLPAHKAHAFSVFKVDRGKKNHGRHSRKLPISARPVAWLFSTWN